MCVAAFNTFITVGGTTQIGVAYFKTQGLTFNDTVDFTLDFGLGHLLFA